MAAPDPDDLQPRDKLLSRLLADSLAAPAASDEVCPDAETIAAYADRGLPNYVVAKLDEHFASCARCQQILVALALSSDELPARVEALQPQAPPAPLPFPVQQTAPPGFARANWRWLAPAAAVAAAVALWFALRPMSQTQTLSARNEAPAAQAPVTQVPVEEPSTNENKTEAAPADVPAAVAAVPATPPVIAGSAGAASQQSKELSADALKKAQASGEAANLDAAAPTPNPSAAKTEPQQALQAEKRAPGVVGGLGAGSSLGGSPPLPRAAIAVPGAPPPTANAPAAEQAKTGGLGGAATLSARAAPLAMAPAQTAIFSAPGGAALWRAGMRGSIERSLNQGRTWERQVSGVTSDLTAGVAVSPTSAWVVGRAGVILRTADGMSWQRVPFSAGPSNSPTPDFTGIDARDTLHATATTADGHHFNTQDGGQTWKAQ